MKKQLDHEWIYMYKFQNTTLYPIPMEKSDLLHSYSNRKVTINIRPLTPPPNVPPSKQPPHPPPKKNQLGKSVSASVDQHGGYNKSLLRCLDEHV